MRMNCPYCGICLSYEASGSSADWTFLRCAKCSSLCIAKSEKKKKVLLPKHVFSPFAITQPESTEIPQTSKSGSPGRSRKPLVLGVLGFAVFAASFLVDQKNVTEISAPPQDRAITTHQSAPTQVAEVQKVEVLVPNAILRSGPGQNFRKMGMASPGTRFSVLGHDKQWTKVEIQSGNSNFTENRSESIAWIRSDLVKAVSFVNSIEVAP